MKKKLLFVIPALQLGGAEKSFVNLLNVIDYDKFDVDVFLFTKTGFFLELIPEQVTLLQESADFRNFSKPFFKSLASFWRKPFLLLNKLLFTINNIISENSVVAEQTNWKYLRHFFPIIEKEYDVAIGYLEKSSNYFVIEKTKAKKKIAWIHTDLENLGINFNLENPFLNQFNFVVTVSEGLSNRLSEKLPDLKKRIKTIENINSKNLILKLANEFVPQEFDSRYFNIIFVGRLAKEKGLSNAINAVAMLLSRGHKVRFYLVGTGDQKNDLMELAVKKNITNSIYFLGSRSNPYPYIKNSHLFLLTSLYEGKSIALEEAKLLQLPAVITCFTSAKDQIVSNKNGLIVEMNPSAIADAIERILKNSSLQKQFRENLSSLKGNENEVKKLYELLNE
jgi:glycosyltransferase involved in cell wall biosynthesis